MSAKGNAPIIIKRKKVVGGDGHHGGAWKVAYADFVTAMMAFFLLMWLLNATTEKQRKGIADYFNPTIPVNRISGGGDGSFNGDSVFTEETLARNGTGASHQLGNIAQQPDDGQKSAEDEMAFSSVEKALSAFSGESMAADNALRHIITRVTDEGLVIEIFDLDDAPLFEALSTEPTEITYEILDIITEAISIVRNELAVAGYVRSQPLMVIENSVWSLSNARADRIRELLGEKGLRADRVERVTGYADQKPALTNPMAARNNRIEIILLRRP